MSKAVLNRVYLVQGVMYWPGSVADETDLNRYNYLLGMGAFVASAAAVTTPPVVPGPRVSEPMTGRPGSLTR